MFIFWLGLIFLIVLSYLDLKTQRIDNWLIALFAILGLALSYNNIVPRLIGFGIILAFTYICWRFNTIGGADAKLLPCIIFWLPSFGIANTLVITMFFIIVFGIIASIYGFLYGKMYTKKQNHIPLIPIITLAYIIICLVKIH